MRKLVCERGRECVAGDGKGVVLCTDSGDHSLPLCLQVSRENGSSAGEEDGPAEPLGQEGQGDDDPGPESHKPPGDQPSTSGLPSASGLPSTSSMESDPSVGLPDDETSMDIPASSVPTMPPLRPTFITG